MTRGSETILGYYSDSERLELEKYLPDRIRLHYRPGGKKYEFRIRDEDGNEKVIHRIRRKDLGAFWDRRDKVMASAARHALKRAGLPAED